jgi:hypothetical protein
MDTTQYLQWLGVASLGGVVGTAAMDSIKYIGHKARLIGGVRMDMLGRWSLGMLHGKFVHADIHASPVCAGENMAGWIFHYLTGIVVAWFFPLFALAFGMTMSPPQMSSAILFGLSTSVLPWFMVYPAFGKGWFGSRAPKAARPVLTSVVSHTFYGAGIGAVFIMAA